MKAYKVKRQSQDTSIGMNAIRKHKWWLFGIILLGGLITLREGWQVWRENSQDEHILAAAQRYGVDPALVKAVVWRESRFNPKARGQVGEVGLMQIGELAAQEWAEAERLHFFDHQDLFDPGKNTRCGTWFLRKLIRRYAHTDNPLAYALADYNAGRSRVLKWIDGAGKTNSSVFLEQMDFPGTRDYIRSILKRYDYYKANFPPKQTMTVLLPHPLAIETELKQRAIADKKFKVRLIGHES